MGRGPAMTERPCAHCGRMWKPARRHDHGGKPVRFCSKQCHWDSIGAKIRTEKACSKCGKVKTIDAFQRDRTTSDGRKSWCRECKKQYQLEYDLGRYYGISYDEYIEMVEAQGGVCAICGNGCSSGRRLAVDHDHETGRIRALLCGNCNKGLGNFQENEELLGRAAGYLYQQRMAGEANA